MDPYVTILRAEAYVYHKEYVSKSPELYQAQTLKRIQTGADITTSAYIQARRQLEKIRRSVAQVFETVEPKAFKSADRSGDGKLTITEFVTYRKIQFDEADTNKDGVLTREEVEVWRSR